MTAIATILDPTRLPLRLEYLSAAEALALYMLLAAPVLWMGLRSMAWIGPTRRAVAIGVRLAVLWVLVMIVAGVRWQRQHRDLEVVVLRDVSDSTTNLPTPPNTSLQSLADDFLRTAVTQTKPPRDRLGAIRFAEQALVESLPDVQLHLGTTGINLRGDGTDIATAINLGLACFSGEAMKRLVLVSDGNATQGNTAEALAAASAAHVPVDVLPLTYHVQHEVMLDRLVAPVSAREGEPLAVEVVLRSTNSQPVSGTLTLIHGDLPADLDADAPGNQASMPIVLRSGANPIRLKVLAGVGSGLDQFRAVFQADSADADTIAANNAADAFTFILGRNRVLYVDNAPDGEGAHLQRALCSQLMGNVQVDRISVGESPMQLMELAQYDAVILANVPRGPDGLGEDQQRNLARYVHDMGGGLVVIGGTEALGAGGWQGSELEQVLPLRMDIPARRVLPSGALVLVLDHSGSMGEAMPNDASVSKQQVANESAILALRTLVKEDYVGVVAFDGAPTWVVPLEPNRDGNTAEQRVAGIGPAGGTSIGPALEEAVAALAKLTPQQVAVKRIVLLTDGRSQPYDFDRVMQALRAARITLCTVAVGGDADRQLLEHLAAAGKGPAYVVDNSARLTQVFVREARTLRRPLIHEPPGGIVVAAENSTAGEPANLFRDAQLPRLTGMVLTSRKAEPAAQVILSAANEHHDPVLAIWQTGLGKSAVFTGDATARWAGSWIASPVFDAFWTQLLRTVARPPVSSDFEVQVVREGPRTRLIVEAADERGAAMEFFNFRGRVSGPDAKADGELRFVQTGPGRYESLLDTPLPGNYAAAVQYSAPDGRRGTLLAGATVVGSVEQRDLRSDDVMMKLVAAQTGGRVLPGFNAAGADLFRREGLTPSVSSMPIWDILVSVVLAMLIADVATRRIAWDWPATKRMAFATGDFLRSFTTTRKIETRQSLEAMKRARATAARFETPGEQSGLTQLVGGAMDKPALETEKEAIDSTESRNRTSSLLAAKRRAQQKIREKEEDQK